MPNSIELGEEPVYADASHWMHSISAEDSSRAESGSKIDLTDIDLTAIGEDENIPDKGKAHSFGRKLNIVLCAHLTQLFLWVLQVLEKLHPLLKLQV